LKEKIILFGVCSEKGDIMQASSGWVKNTGKGKVFYFQAGHSESDFDNVNFLQVLRNAIEWK
jgi:type 1 glutamine amidotransferase